MQQQQRRYGQSVDGDRRLRNIIERHRKRSEYDSGDEVAEQWNQTWDWILGGGLLMGGLFVMHKWNMRALRKNKKEIKLHSQKDTTQQKKMKEVMLNRDEQLKLRVLAIHKKYVGEDATAVPEHLMYGLKYEDSDKLIREKMNKNAAEWIGDHPEIF